MESSFKTATNEPVIEIHNLKKSFESGTLCHCGPDDNAKLNRPFDQILLQLK